ncbi:MAG: hypothetical protein REI09_07405, partial [Candidatus Dactylopiibacterium sp.]|nr:hypothetical protein [Candidatus Dactylopiibacterium sp.]
PLVSGAAAAPAGWPAPPLRGAPPPKKPRPPPGGPGGGAPAPTPQPARHAGRALAGPRIDWIRTLAAKGPAPLAAAHLRHRPPHTGGAMLHCVLLDCSASMLRGQRLALAKGLLQAWGAHCYRRRETLAVIGFSGDAARLIRAPAKATARQDWIAPIAGGGGSPAHAAIALAEHVMARHRRQAPGAHITLWLLSDARFQPLPPRPALADQCTVIDFDTGARALGRARQLAQAWQAGYAPAAALTNPLSTRFR